MAVGDPPTYQDFDLLVERVGAATYRARVLRAPGRRDARPVEFSLPFEPFELELLLVRVSRPRHGGTRKKYHPETEAIRSFGERLYDAVFQDELRELLWESVREAGSHRAGLRLRLMLSDAPELAQLPWESLYDKRRRRFLALWRRTSLVRYLELPDPPSPLTVQPPLHVLVMIGPSPDGYSPLDVEQEWTKLREALRGLDQEAERVTVERLERPTLGALLERLRAGEFHVFHFIGHGGFDPELDDGVLILEDASGGIQQVTGEDLGGLLNDHEAMRLAVLNACEGARADATDPFAGTAQSLIQQGLPAVVAMQFEITDEAAITFTKGLYGAVADGDPIDAALVEARKAIRYGLGNLVEWATPVLYLRAPDGRIFDVTPSDEERSRVGAEREAAEREAAEREAAEWQAREREREAAEWRTAQLRTAQLRTEQLRTEQLRTASDGVDRAEELLRGRNYARAIAVCAEVRRKFGNSADPALAAHVARARELSQRARQQQARRRLRRWGAVGIAAAVAAGSYLGWRLDGTGPEERRVELLGTRNWTDTGVDCKAGEALEIAASGSIYHSNKNKRGTSVGPDGDPDPSRRKANIPGLPDANHAALIGSIARQQPYFLVGRSTVYACPGEGRLFLGINDKDVANNGGRFSATIKR